MRGACCPQTLSLLPLRCVVQRQTLFVKETLQGIVVGDAAVPQAFKKWFAVIVCQYNATVFQFNSAFHFILMHLAHVGLRFISETACSFFSCTSPCPSLLPILDPQLCYLSNVI